LERTCLKRTHTDIRDFNPSSVCDFRIFAARPQRICEKFTSEAKQHCVDLLPRAHVSDSVAYERKHLLRGDTPSCLLVNFALDGTAGVLAKLDLSSWQLPPAV
jgi:hypothetical protein